MIVLAITFRAGELHAQPWDQSAKGGVSRTRGISWPPSPWTVLRAIVLAFETTGETDRETLMRACDRMASAPRFVLPPTVTGHPRHAPLHASTDVAELVLDADRSTTHRDARAFIIWDDVRLSTQEALLLERLLSGITRLAGDSAPCVLTLLDHAPDADSAMADVRLASIFGGDTPGPKVRRLGIDGNVRGRGLIAALSQGAADGTSRARLPRGSAWLDYRFRKTSGAIASRASAPRPKRASRAACFATALRDRRPMSGYP